MSFTEKLINVQVTLGTGSFGASGNNVVTISGLRVSATITKIGTPSLNSALIRIYGLDRSTMNQLTQIGFVWDFTRRNVVSVFAGDSVTGTPLIFAGGIHAAWQDMTSAPETAFIISAYTSYLSAMKPVLPSSYTGTVDVAVIMADLAKKMGFQNFEGNNVHVNLTNPYLPGTALDQALAAAEAADIYVVFEDDGQTMAIVRKDGARGTPVPLIAPPPDGGMSGYPSYVGPGLIHVRTLFNPQVRFLGNINIQSSIGPANGLWTVIQATHDIESQMPDGNWFTDITANAFLPGVG